MHVANAFLPDPCQAAPFFGRTEEGPFVRGILLRCKASAEYPDGPDSHMTGEEAYGRYGPAGAKLVTTLGGEIQFSGRISGLLLGEVEDLWDAVALAQYPSPEAFMAVAASVEYRAMEHPRTADLAGQRNIRTVPTS